jgi:hypothetical protein
VNLAGQDANAYGYDYQNQLIFLKPQIPVNTIDEEAQATQDRRLHEHEESSLVNSVISNMMGNLHLERASEIQSNIEQTHREIAIDSNLNVASTQGVASPLAAA